MTSDSEEEALIGDVEMLENEDELRRSALETMSGIKSLNNEELLQRNLQLLEEIEKLKSQLVKHELVPARDEEMEELTEHAAQGPSRVGSGKSRTPAQDRLIESRVQGRGKRVSPNYRHVDMIKFPRLECKLSQNGETSFRLWQLNIRDAIESQECAFLLTGKDLPDEYKEDEQALRVAAKKTKMFIMAHLDPHYQDMVGNMSDPKEIMDMLTRYCEPTGRFFLSNLMARFSQMRFMPESETPIEFINRFDKIVRKIRELNVELMNETFVKQTFMVAIRSTRTYQREMTHDTGYSINEVKSMFVEEFNEKEQMSLMDDHLRSGAMMSRGQKKAQKRGGSFRQRQFRRSGGGDWRWNGTGSFSTSSDRVAQVRVKKGKGPTCFNCQKRGHTRNECRSRVRKCYNCQELGTHIASNCPNPSKSPRSVGRNPQHALMSGRSKSGHAQTAAKSKPKLVRMRMGEAKKLKSHFERLGHSSSFYIAGNDVLPDNTQTWVVLDDEAEQEEVAMVNYSRERMGKTALKVAEGVSYTTFLAVIDSGATEHLANRKEYFEELKAFDHPKRFTCANKDVDADLICEYYGDILIMNNGKVSRLKNVLYTPDLTVNLFSLRKAAGAGMEIKFTKEKAVFTSPDGKEIKEGNFHDSYWWVEFDLVHRGGTKRKYEDQVSCLHLKHCDCVSKSMFSSSNSVGDADSQSRRSLGDSAGGRSPQNANMGGRKHSDTNNTEHNHQSQTQNSPEVVIETESSNSETSALHGGSSESYGVSVSGVILDRSERPARNITELDLLKIGEKFGETLRNNKDLLWHVRLNHASKKYLEAATKFVPEMKGVKITDRVLDCEECAQAKTVRKSHTEVRRREDKPFAVLHSDLMGPIKPLNFRNQAKYVVTFMCDATRYVFVYTLKDKTEVHKALHECLDEVRCITNDTESVHTIRTDSGLEYKTVCMKELLNKERIKLVMSEPHTPQLNGSAERLNRELVEKVRVNLLSAKMPPSFWGHALNYVVYIHNRLPHASNDFVSPYEVLFGREPSMKYVRRFGCLSMVVNTKPKTKFAPNARRAYLLECGDTGYVLFDEEHKTLLRSCDVRCIEHVVYGDKIKEYPKPLAEFLEIGSEMTEDPEELAGTANLRALKSVRGSFYAEPKSYKEVAANPDRELWFDSIRDELESLETKGTWEFVHRKEVEPGTKIIKARWVHKRKLESNGSYRFKSRLVAKGFADTNEYDLNEIYAPVARLTDVRLILSIANQLDLVLHQLDVKTAFLHGELEKPVFMEIPEGVIELTQVSSDLAATHVCKLVKSLYGLKVSPNLWYKKFSTVLKGLGFIVYEFQKCIFRWQEGEKFVLLLIYVDDCLLASNCARKAKEIIGKIALEIDINDFGSPKKFLGVEIVRDRANKRIFMSQEHFIREILSKYLIEKTKTSNLPMFPKTNSLNCQLNNSGESPRVPYREVIGSLLYLQNCTRPDISYAVNFLSRKQVGYTDQDWECVQKVLQYLNGTLELGVMLTGKSNEIMSYTDASLGTNDLNGRSTTGFLIYAFGDLVSWKSKKQTHVSLSSAEAEYIAMSAACKELISVRAVCKFLIGVDVVPTLHCDCKPAIALAKTDESRTLKHIVKLSYHYVREEFNNENVKIEWVGTDEQLADLLTKPLPMEKFESFRAELLTQKNE